MYGHQFPVWVPVLFFVVLLTVAYIVGKWLVKNDRNYKGLL
jgi:type VI protein secretion system component VasF